MVLSNYASSCEQMAFCLRGEAFAENSLFVIHKRFFSCYVLFFTEGVGLVLCRAFAVKFDVLYCLWLLDGLVKRISEM
jgi:hypothetical protein